MFRITTGLRRISAVALSAIAMAGAPASAASIGSEPSLSINTVSLVEGDSGTTQFVFTVSLDSAAPVGGVRFDIATADDSAIAGLDYVAKSLTDQSIAAGQLTYTFTVDVLGDLLVESIGPLPGQQYEAFLVNVRILTNAVAMDNVGEGFILDDDVARAVPEPASLALAMASLAALAAVRGRARRLPG